MPTRPLSSLYFTDFTDFNFSMACSTFTSAGNVTCRMVLLNIDFFISMPGMAPASAALHASLSKPFCMPTNNSPSA